MLMAAAGISMLVFIGICSAVGLRLVSLARRTRGSHELFCGLGFLLIGLFGYPAATLSGHGVKSVGEVLMPAYLFGSFFMHAGIGCFFVFTWKVFRRDEDWARGLCWMALVSIAMAWLGSAYALLTATPDASSFQVTLVPASVRSNTIDPIPLFSSESIALS